MSILFFSFIFTRCVNAECWDCLQMFVHLIIQFENSIAEKYESFFSHLDLITQTTTNRIQEKKKTNYKTKSHSMWGRQQFTMGNSIEFDDYFFAFGCSKKRALMQIKNKMSFPRQ